MLEDGIFPLQDIQVFFQDFQPGTYQQIGSPGKFIQNLSIIDALMNIGAQGTAELVKKGTGKWLTWEEMIALKSH